MELKLNLGCGEVKIPHYVNVDVEESLKPDVVCNFIKAPLPFEDSTVDEVLLFHCIEHIEKRLHGRIYCEIFRVLKPNGRFLLSFPEFTKCAENYITNYKGMREFWEQTIYGLQRYPSDFHVSAMNSKEVSYLLRDIGFFSIVFCPEPPPNEYNSIVSSKKGLALQTREESHLLTFA